MVPAPRIYNIGSSLSLQMPIPDLVETCNDHLYTIVHLEPRSLLQALVPIHFSTPSSPMVVIRSQTSVTFSITPTL
jgi:hypothetical protein